MKQRAQDSLKNFKRVWISARARFEVPQFKKRFLGIAESKPKLCALYVECISEGLSSRGHVQSSHYQ
jgi:hypothetical protein